MRPIFDFRRRKGKGVQVQRVQESQAKRVKGKSFFILSAQKRAATHFCGSSIHAIEGKVNAME